VSNENALDVSPEVLDVAEMKDPDVFSAFWVMPEFSRRRSTLLSAKVAKP
jgi:hypothetical protein